MNYYNFYDKTGKIIARCQPIKDIDTKKMGRQIAMKKIIKMEESACLLFDRKSL